MQEALYQCRTELAISFNVMPYMIASNEVLDQIALIQPSNMNELHAKIDGQSEAKILKFRPSLLGCVFKHKNLLSDVDSLRLVILLTTVYFLKKNHILSVGRNNGDALCSASHG